MAAPQVARQLQEQALGILLSVLRSYGIVGGASKFLAVSSNVFNATFMGRGASQANAPTAQRAEVSNVGHGLLEGGRALGSTLFRGFTGIVTRPLEGAEQGGLGGFVTGVGRGLVGVAAAPVGGMLAAASQVTAGIDASYTKVRSTSAACCNCKRCQQSACSAGMGHCSRPVHATGHSLLVHTHMLLTVHENAPAQSKSSEQGHAHAHAQYTCTLCSLAHV